MTTDARQVERLRELLAAVHSDLPWRANDASEWLTTGPKWEVIFTPTVGFCAGEDVSVANYVEESDATLIAAAVNALPDLLATAEAHTALVKAVEGLLADEWRDEPPSRTYPEGRRLYRWPGDLRDELSAILAATDTAADPVGAGERAGTS